MRRVVWSEHARTDFLDVIAYIAQDNPSAAARVAARIDTTIRALSAAPTDRKGRVSDTYEKPVRRLP